MGKNKKRHNKKSIRVQQQDEYDLKASLNKLNQRGIPKSDSTISEFGSNKTAQKLDSSVLTSNLDENTGFIFQINESINSRYDKLKDDISNVTDKINDSSDRLRTDIESKLDKKVNSNLFYRLFYGAISVLVVIATIIYLFSYSGLIKDTDSNKQKIDSLINKDNSAEQADKAKTKPNNVYKK